MIVQWCAKGLALGSDDEARAILDNRGGLQSNWFRDVKNIPIQEIRERLTAMNLNRHVNHFMEHDPATGRPFSEMTPFISLSAGVVERAAAEKTNYVHRARKTAIWFGTNFGRTDTAYLYICWVIIALRSAVEVEGIGEEIRDLNTYRRYSEHQTEGEITAKVWIPDNQIQCCERWDLVADDGAKYVRTAVFPNARFTPPSLLTNIRELI